MGYNSTSPRALQGNCLFRENDNGHSSSTLHDDTKADFVVNIHENAVLLLYFLFCFGGRKDCETMAKKLDILF